MEKLMKKYQNKYKRATEEMDKWSQLQSQFLVQFGNVSAIIGRLSVLQDGNNYGVLSSRNSMKEELLGKQMESLEINMLALHERQKEFHAIVKSLERISRDAHLLLKEEQKHVSLQQMDARVGGCPSVSDCLEGLRIIHEMHLSEYRLKSSVVLALKWNSSPGDLAAFSQLLSDQPNIPKLEVQLIFARIFMDDIN